MAFQSNAIGTREIAELAIGANGPLIQPYSLIVSSNGEVQHLTQSLNEFDPAHSPRVPWIIYKQVNTDIDQIPHKTDVILAEKNSQGYLFVTVKKTINGTLHTWHMSNQWVDGGVNLWEQKIISMPAIHFRAKEGGGFITLNWGSISFLPGSFTDNSTGEVLDPPHEVEIEAHWGSRDSTAFRIFEGEAYLRSESEESLDFDLYEQEFEQEALDWGLAAGANTDVIIINEMAPAETPIGDEIIVTTGQPHGLSAKDEILLQPVDNTAASTFTEGGKYSVKSVVDTSNFILDLPGFGSYTADSAEMGTELVPQPLILGTVEHILPQPTGVDTGKRYYRPDVVDLIGGTPSTNAFDDGLNVTGNYTSDGLTLPYIEPDSGMDAVGKFSISGTGSMTSLHDLFTWAAFQLGELDYQWRASEYPEDIAINCVITEQMQLLDLLDQIAGYCNFSFTILNGVISLFKNDSAAASLGTWNETDVHSLDYSHEMPTRTHKASWKVNEGNLMRTDSVVATPAFAPTLDATTKEVFLQGASPMGDVREYKVFDQKRGDVTQKIKALKAEREKPEVRASIPMEGLPRVGFSFDYQDNYRTPAQLIQVVVRDLKFDFENHSIELTGKAMVLS